MLLQVKGDSEGLVNKGSFSSSFSLSYGGSCLVCVSFSSRVALACLVSCVALLDLLLSLKTHKSLYLSFFSTILLLPFFHLHHFHFSSTTLTTTNTATTTVLASSSPPPPPPSPLPLSAQLPIQGLCICQGQRVRCGGWKWLQDGGDGVGRGRVGGRMWGGIGRGMESGRNEGGMERWEGGAVSGRGVGWVRVEG